MPNCQFGPDAVRSAEDGSGTRHPGAQTRPRWLAACAARPALSRPAGRYMAAQTLGPSAQGLKQQPFLGFRHWCPELLAFKAAFILNCRYGSLTIGLRPKKQTQQAEDNVYDARKSLIFPASIRRLNCRGRFSWTSGANSCWRAWISLC